MQVSNKLHVRYLSPNDVPPNSRADEGVSEGDHLDDGSWAQELWTRLGQMMRMKHTKSTPADYEAFLDYWKHGPSVKKTQ